jgi:hypothetical protein
MMLITSLSASTYHCWSSPHPPLGFIQAGPASTTFLVRAWPDSVHGVDEAGDSQIGKECLDRQGYDMRKSLEDCAIDDGKNDKGLSPAPSRCIEVRSNPVILGEEAGQLHRDLTFCMQEKWWPPATRPRRMKGEISGAASHIRCLH